MKSFFKRTKVSTFGFTIVEVLIACAIISITTFSIMAAASKGIQLSTTSLKTTEANTLLEEGAEAVKSIRDASWSNISSLSLNTNYYLSFNNTSNIWQLVQSPIVVIDGTFTRFIVISSVNRDSNDDIAQTGTQDLRTKKVDVTVLWNEASGQKSKILSFYISDIFN